MDNPVIVYRSPQEIAAEINAIRRRAARQLLEDSVEVGRLLTEAKSSVAHGEWGGWLEENFQYSSTEANNLMRLFEAYGTKEQIGLFEEDRTAIFGRLNKSQALALLGLPEPERAAFVAENPPEEISVREWEARIEAAKKAAFEEGVEDGAEYWQKKLDEKQSEVDEAVKKAVIAEEERIRLAGAAREAADKLAKASARAEAAENDAKSARKIKADLKKAQKQADDAQEAKLKALGEKAKIEAERDALQVRVDDMEKNPVVTVREPTAEELAAIEERVREQIGAEADALKKENEKLRLAADPTVQRFSRHFEAFREAYAQVRDLVAEIGEEKYRAALAKVIAAMSAEIGGVHGN